MIILNVFLTVAPNKIADFISAINEITAKSKQEKGNLLYDFYQKDHQFCIIEHWQDSAALEHHNQTTHLKIFVEQILTLLVKPPHIERYESAE